MSAWQVCQETKIEKRAMYVYYLKIAAIRFLVFKSKVIYKGCLGR